MKIGEFLMKALPYVAAVVVFWAVSAVYFAPQLGGKTLEMNDVQMYQGMRKDILDHRAAHDGEDPQWTGGMFGGMPAYLITVQYPAMIIRNATQSVMNFLGEPMALMFLAMVGFWLMLLMAGINPWLAIPFAIAYGLSTYNILIIEAGHITKMRAMGYVPMLLGAVFYTFRGKMWLGGALAALFGTLTIAASHHQITYYFLLVIVAYWINTLIVALREKTQKRFWKATLVLLAAAALAGGANFTHLWYTAQHTPDTIRGGSEVVEKDISTGNGVDLEYATAWSYGIGESVNMFIPNFRGEGSSAGFKADGPVAQALKNNRIPPSVAAELPAYGASQYWGKQPFTGGPTYLGAVMVFLFVLGMIVLPARKKWWVLAVSIFTLLLAWGGNWMWFTELAFKVLPGYNKFRTVSMALVVLQWAVPFVAALTVAKLASREFDRRRMNISIYVSLGVVGCVALVFALFGGLMYDFAAAGDAYVSNIPGLVDAIRAERLAEFRADCWRSLGMVALTAAVVWVYANLQVARQWMLVAALGVLAVADLVPVGLRYLSHDDFREPARIKIVPDQANLSIMRDKEPGYRVLNADNPFNDGLTSYFHRSVGGYHGAKLARYQDVIDRYLANFDDEVLDALNTKYIIRTNPETGKREVMMRESANGPAWFVDRVMFADDPHEELAALDTLDTKTQAVVDKRFADRVGYFFAASKEDTIALAEYRPNYLRYESTSDTEEVAVFSEIYYDKGWRAYIDGVPTPYFRADYILRAMVVPAGKHTIEWRFRAPRFATVEGVTLGASIAILAWLVAATIICFRRRWKIK